MIYIINLSKVWKDCRAGLNYFPFGTVQPMFVLTLSLLCFDVPDHGLQPREVHDERHVSSNRGYAAVHGARAPRKGECEICRNACVQ